MIRGKTKETVKVKELILCGRKLQLWTLSCDHIKRKTLGKKNQTLAY